MHRPVLLVLTLMLLATACRSLRTAAAQEAPSRNAEVWQTLSGEGVTVEFREPDREQAERLVKLLAKGHRTITDFFHRPFPHRFPARIYPDRAALTSYWRTAWGIPDLQPEPWMVASGTATMLTILSPAVWKTEAAEHDPADTTHLQRLLTHEMVHVFHAQNNPHPDFDGMDDAAWFVEGLAVYVSGQLADRSLASAKEAITQGKEPRQLARAWSGRYRYGVSGSIVAYIEAAYGRKKIDAMLKGTSQAELLQTLGITEQQLLEQWRAYVISGRARRPSETK
jgi:hypothetical protein